LWNKKSVKLKTETDKPGGGSEVLSFSAKKKKVKIQARTINKA